MPNFTVTYGEIQPAARQLLAREQQTDGDLQKLRRLVEDVIAGRYVTDASSPQFRQ